MSREIRAFSGSHSRILSVGSFRPERVVTNAELVEAIDSSDEWIRQRSGIVSRRFANPETTVIDMAEHSARQAIARSGLELAQIDAILVATVTHPYQTPSAATLLTQRLGLPGIPAMDISAACAGFCHGLGLASDMIRAGSAHNVLVIGVEKLSDFTDLTDRGTAFIFGDGAGAVIVGPSDEPRIGPTVWGSDGAQWDAIANNKSWLDYRASEQRPEDWPYLTMQGRAVFRWAVWKMSPAAKQAMDVAGVTPDDLDVFLPHQANIRIIDAMVKELKLPDHVKVARDIVDNGNTSAASIPMAMDRMLADSEASSGDLALMIGYGAGLAYAGQVAYLP